MGALAAELPPIGQAGLDLFVHVGPDGLRLRVAELNPRPTLGRVALALERRVQRGRVGLWRVVTEREVGPIQPWAERLRAEHPLATRGHPAVVTEGVLFTADPRGAAVTSVLAVGGGLAEIEAWIVNLSGGSP